MEDIKLVPNMRVEAAIDPIRLIIYENNLKKFEVFGQVIYDKETLSPILRFDFPMQLIT